MNEPTPEQLLNIIKNPTAFKDTKEMILYLHLWIEHYVNEMVCYYGKDEIHETLQENLTFDTKIRFLKKVSAIPQEDICRALTSINQIRNFLSHKLLINPEMIWSKLNSLTFSFKLPYQINNEDFIDLGKEYKKQNFNKLDKFRISAQLLVGILYTKLKIIKGEEFDQLFYPKFEKDVCHVLLMKKSKESSKK